MRGLKLLLDNSLEIGTAVARGASVLAFVGAIVAGVGTIWSTGADTEKWAATVALMLGVAGGVGWLGWWVLGNENWRKQGGQDAG